MGIIVGFALCFQRIKDTNLTLDSHLFLPLFLRRTHVTEMSYYISSIEDSKRIFRAIRDHWKIENQLHYMLDVYLGEDGWSKRAGEAAINMELMAKIDLFILQRLKAKLGKSIPRVQMFLAKLNPLQLFELGL